MKKEDDVEKYINRIENLSAQLVNMGEKVTKAEIASYILNGLPTRYQNVKRIFRAN